MALLPMLLGLVAGLQPVGLAMTSPWWEDYDIKERYLCAENGGVVLERNASQATLISRGSHTTFFRETSSDPALIYRNDDFRLILRGDELTLERLPMTITCLRSEQV
jgi:hypothetical protein